MLSMPPAKAAQHDHLRRRNNGLSARSADAIQRQCRRVHADLLDPKSHVAGTVKPVVAGLIGIAHDHVADQFGVNLGSLQRLLACDSTQLAGADVLEFAISGSARVFRHRSSSAGQNDDVFVHLSTSSLGFRI
jgi:hypothetical protein